MSYIDYLDIDPILWPKIHPFEEGYIKVSRVHTLWFAQYGNPKGIPVLILHGGPGFGCRGNEMRYFDTSVYRLILLDQRGCGRSFPLYEIRDNSTQYLIEDIEKVRILLNIDKWLLYGGSWGATLGLVYAQSYVSRVLGFILRGTFTADTQQWRQIWFNMRLVFPDIWEDFCNFLPKEERGNVFLGYYKRLMSKDEDVLIKAARSFIKYDMICSLFNHSQLYIDYMMKNTLTSISTAKFFAYYSMHNFFIKPGQIFNNLYKISHLPCILLHGRHDQLSLPFFSYALHSAWPNSILNIVQDAAHSAIEPAMTKAILDSTHNMLNILQK